MYINTHIRLRSSKTFVRISVGSIMMGLNISEQTIYALIYDRDTHNDEIKYKIIYLRPEGGSRIDIVNVPTVCYRDLQTHKNIFIVFFAPWSKLFQGNRQL